MYKEAEGCRDFIIVKDFYKYGSACMCFKPDDQNSFRYLLTQCLLLAKWPIQVVRLGGPKALDSYGEYAPYTFYTDSQDLLNICMSGEAPGVYLPGMEELKEREREEYSNWIIL